MTEKTIKSYRNVCAKLGLFMCVYFICRTIAHYAGYYILGVMLSHIESSSRYVIQTGIQILLIYIVPILTAALLFNSLERYNEKKGEFRTLYQKPKRLAKKLGSFPAMYGLGYGINLITILLFFLIRTISRSMDASYELLRFFEPIVFEPPRDIISAIVLVFMMVVVAPVLEEFLLRGIIYNALKPYGTGMAIVISSLLFGLMHGSIHMLFYTTALGFALGYVRYATNSLFVVTVLHALINAVAAGLVFFVSLESITRGANALAISLGEIYMVAMLVLIVVGIVAIIKKIPVIKKYKIENGWNEISSSRKFRIFCLSVPVLAMTALAVNEFTNNFLLEQLILTLLR